MNKFFLIDVSYLCYRAHYGGTGAVTGFQTYVQKLMEQEPTYMAFCCDSGSSFRVALYSNYKTNRAPMPAELAAQLQALHSYIDSLNVPKVQVEGYEADDVIASLTDLGLKNNLEVTVVSGDKDFVQLVGPAVRLYDVTTERSYNEAAVFAKWGVKPCQFVDYLALVGDSSDSIPGVRGIGAKTAAALLSQFETLNEIYGNLERVKSDSLRTNLVNGRESATLSRKLAILTADCEVPTDIFCYKFVTQNEN